MKTRLKPTASGTEQTRSAVGEAPVVQASFPFPIVGIGASVVNKRKVLFALATTYDSYVKYDGCH